jgi:hypothetical protein
MILNAIYCLIPWQYFACVTSNMHQEQVNELSEVCIVNATKKW